jgi:hypothetical protein
MIHRLYQWLDLEAAQSLHATHTLTVSIVSRNRSAPPPAHRKGPPSDGVSCSEDAPADIKLSLPSWARDYRFTGTLRPALYGPRRTVPPGIRRPDYADHYAGVSESEQRDKQNHNNIRIYTEKELGGEAGLRHACRVGREVLDIAGKALRPGVTTDEIDRIVHEATIERDWYDYFATLERTLFAVRDAGSCSLFSLCLISVDDGSCCRYPHG